MVEYGRCPLCGHLMLPVLDDSPCGHTDAVTTHELDAIGTVYSWTVFHLGAAGPIVMAMADFFEGALRVTAPLLGAESVAIGDAVRVVAGTDTPYALRIV